MWLRCPAFASGKEIFIIKIEKSQLQGINDLKYSRIYLITYTLQNPSTIPSTRNLKTLADHESYSSKMSIKSFTR